MESQELRLRISILDYLGISFIFLTCRQPSQWITFLTLLEYVDHIFLILYKAEGN